MKKFSILTCENLGYYVTGTGEFNKMVPRKRIPPAHIGYMTEDALKRLKRKRR